MKFDDYAVSGEIKANLKDLGFKRPTDIQFKVIPHVLKGEDVLAIAQTGTGKTAAFAIPVLHNLLAKPRRHQGIRCLVMAPTRELAVQLNDVFQSVGKNTPIKSLTVHGGVEQDSQITALLDGVDVLVATPGRMFDLVSQGYLDISHTEILVLDEADHMLDLGFIKDIRQLVDRLPRKRQTLFFSATIDSRIKKLAYSLVKDAIRIQISPKDPVSKNVDHGVAFVEMDDKRFFLERLIRENPKMKMLVFVRTKVRAERVKAALERVEIPSLTIHGDKEQKERFRSLQRFSKGETDILIATDVSARGIDIEGIRMVINYDLPEQPENYVHRVGRTGRGTSRGKAVSFCSKEEKPLLKQIEEYTGNRLQELTVNKQEYQETIDLSAQPHGDWKTLLLEAEKEEEMLKKKKRK